MAVEYKTLYATLQADTNTHTFTDNLISDVSKLTLMTDDDDVYPVDMEITNTHSVSVEISDHVGPVQIALIINNVETYSPVDISDLEDEIQSVSDNLSGLATVVNELSDNVDNIEGDVSTLGTMVTELETTKQDNLTAGENITIENNVISATGGSGGGMIIDTTERVIGTLFGKPLYAKCVPSTIGIGTSATNLSSVLPTEQSDLEIMFDCKFLKLYTSTSAWSIRHVDVYLSDNVYVGKAYDSTGASNYTEMYYYWEYTKRSD